MSADAWVTLAVTLLTIALLAADRFPPALVMGGSVTILLLAGVIDEEGALGGFANDAPITVAALYILAGAAEITGALDAITGRVLGNGGGDETQGAHRRQLARVLFPSMAASAFIANTPLVGMIAPRVVAWARRTGRSSSRYLMPLSYAVIFGGCITVIGTSTNLVVIGLMKDAAEPMEPLGLFEITPAGLPIALIGTALIVMLAPRLLRDRRAPSDQFPKHLREFTIEMKVAEGSPLAGRAIEDAGLRHLEGVFLIAVERGGRTTTAVGPEFELVEGDRLIFAGNVARILDLERMTGLVSAHEQHFEALDRPGSRFYEAVIGPNSRLDGSTLRDVDFRSRYGAAVVAIHRAGERLPDKLGQVRMQVGDVLLLVGAANLQRRFRDHPDFLLVAPLAGGSAPVRRGKAWIVQLLALGMVVAAGTGLVSLLKASLVVALVLIAARVVTPAEARASVDLNVILLMATSFALGVAMHDSGLAAEVAHLIVTAFRPLGDIGLLGGILLATMLMTELLSNNAAAILMFPIAMATASQGQLDPRPFAVVILFGASLSFLTPIGYQANTLVWSMGGYKYRDFSRLGAPLTLATFVATLVLVPLVFPLR